jgi:hypothetical protein
MTKQLTNILAFTVVILLLTSCRVERAARYIYSTTPANVNNFTKKGESKLNATYFGDGKSENGGVQMQAAYAFSNHWAAMASYTNKWERQAERYDTTRFYRERLFSGSIIETNVFDSSVIMYKRLNYELGLGYFYHIGNSNKTIFYVYGGLGFGKQTMTDNGLDSNSIAYSRYYSGNITNYFLQFGYNLRASDNFCFSIGNKLTTSFFKQTSITYSKQEAEYFYLDKVDNNSLFIWEPYLNVQFGLPKYQWVKLDMQMLLSGSNLGYNYPKANNVSMSIGLSFDISKMKKLKH